MESNTKLSFFNQNIRLVYFLANQLKHKYNLSEDDHEEIISAGKLSLWKIIANQSLESRGIKSYLYIRVRGQMIDYLRKKRQLLRIKIKAANQQDLDQINDKLNFHSNRGKSTKQIEDRLTLRNAFRSLNQHEIDLVRRYYFEDQKYQEIYRSRSKSWISKFHSKTLDKLRQVLVNEVDAIRDDRAGNFC